MRLFHAPSPYPLPEGGGDPHFPGIDGFCHPLRLPPHPVAEC
jgi:hypothetical protein